MKKWSKFTGREKVIGVLGMLGAVFVIGGLAQATQSPAVPTVDSTIVPKTETSTKTEPVITHQEVTVEEEIPFGKVTQESSAIAKGVESITTNGKNGITTKTFKVTYADGLEKSRELISEVVTTEATDEVTTVGTYVAPVQKVQPTPQSSCDSNYSGCVPIASDVDCAGGSGNGPAYVSGPVYVTGSDHYDLDRDGDGVACE